MKMMRWNVLLLCLTGAGCFNVKVMAPHGQEVYLVSSTEPAKVERRWRTWYVAWGMTPLDNTMPAEIIQREHLSEVRVIVEDTLPDAAHSFLYNFVTPIGLVPQTIVIQGNRPPEHVSAAIPVQSKPDR